MENNFYVGNIRHKKRLLNSSIETSVLYSCDDNNYLDLISGKLYDTDHNKKDYVIRQSLRETNIEDHRFDYLYLLARFEERKKSKGRTRKKVRSTCKQ